MASEANRTWTFVGLLAAGLVAAGLVYAAFAEDKAPAGEVKAPLDAGAVLQQVGVLGPAKLLPETGPEPRVEVTFALNPDLMPDDLGAVSLTSPFVVGQMKTGTFEEKADGDLTRVRIRHRILPAVAWFQGEAARRDRAWVGALMQWELDVTQRELLALYPDAAVPDGGLPKPPSLTVTGVAVSYRTAVTRIPELGTEAARKYLCMGEDACNDEVLGKVIVLVVD